MRIVGTRIRLRKLTERKGRARALRHVIGRTDQIARKGLLARWELRLVGVTQREIEAARLERRPVA